MRKFLSMLLLLFALTLPSPANDPAAAQFKWRVGEELVYKVRYAFLTVGTLHFWVLGKDTLRNRPVYHCKLHMKSSSAIPFVHIDDVYESYIDEEMYTHLYQGYEQNGDHILSTKYDFDYAAGKINITVQKFFENDTLLVLDSTAALSEKVQDGLSLLFYARAYAKQAAPQDIAIFVFNQHKSTFINFGGQTDEVKAKGAKVEGYYLDGKMKFVGIAGIKEDFKGWFSPDAQSVPLFAKMKAFLGSVRLTLEWWKDWEGGNILNNNDQEADETAR